MSTISVTEIARNALNLLGDNIEITSLDDGTKQANHVKLVFNRCLDEVLRAYPWTFALKRYALAHTDEKPTYGYEKIFVYPSDCLRIVEVEGNIPFTVEGNRIYANTDIFKFKGIFRNSIPSQYSSDFVVLLSYLIASEICVAICGDYSLKNNLYQQYQGLLENAKTCNSFENSMRSYTVHGFLDSRKIGVI